MNIKHVTAFGLTLNLSWQKLASIPEAQNTLSKVTTLPNQRMLCESDKFYLAVDDVARYLVIPEQNICFIESAHPDVSYSIIATWLMGTVFAYLLQYHGYLVLHGSAVKINNRAVIFSGESGAGKSTLAAAMLARGNQFLTDDVCVISANSQDKLILVPGPAKLKLWEDALTRLNYATTGLNQVINKANKYELPLNHIPTVDTVTADSLDLSICANSNLPTCEISHFFELIPTPDVATLQCTQLTGIAKLQTLVNNTYRYGMLKPLGKIKSHFSACSKLAEQISVARIMRPTTVMASNNSLIELVTVIEHNLSSTVLNHEYYQGAPHVKLNPTNSSSTH